MYERRERTSWVVLSNLFPPCPQSELSEVSNACEYPWPPPVLEEEREVTEKYGNF